jgi:hypothetical protein
MSRIENRFSKSQIFIDIFPNHKKINDVQKSPKSKPWIANL